MRRFRRFDWSDPEFAEAQVFVPARPLAPLTTGVSISPNRCAIKSPTGWKKCGRSGAQGRSP